MILADLNKNIPSLLGMEGKRGPRMESLVVQPGRTSTHCSPTQHLLHVASLPGISHLPKLGPSGIF